MVNSLDMFKLFAIQWNNTKNEIHDVAMHFGKLYTVQKTTQN